MNICMKENFEVDGLPKIAIADFPWLTTHFLLEILEKPSIEIKVEEVHQIWHLDG